MSINHVIALSYLQNIYNLIVLVREAGSGVH